MMGRLMKILYVDFLQYLEYYNVNDTRNICILYSIEFNKGFKKKHTKHQILIEYFWKIHI